MIEKDANYQVRSISTSKDTNSKVHSSGAHRGYTLIDVSNYYEDYVDPSPRSYPSPIKILNTWGTIWFMGHVRETYRVKQLITAQPFGGRCGLHLES